MRRARTLLSALTLVAGLASEVPVKMKDLPAAVQKTVLEQTKGGELKGLSMELENGKTFYEAETRVNGRGRDVLIDANGAVVEIEEEVTLDSLPAAARAAIEKSASGGKITKVELVTKGKIVTYEAALLKGGKKSEIIVAADGSIRK
jgi:uncharacterized membrane protein YkoI